MREEDKSWFDDPEWERLRHEINGRPFFGGRGRFRLFGKRAEQPAAPQDTRPHYPRRSQQYLQPKAPPPQPPAAPEKVNVSLNLTLPAINYQKILDNPLVAKIRLINIPRKQAIAGGAACLVIVSSFTAIRAFTGKDNKGVEVDTAVLGQSASPEYQPVLPNGGEDSTTSKKVLYDPGKKMASYTDTINGIPITVSQQPLPEQFNDDPDAGVRKLAENFSANTVIKAGGLTGYLGTSAKGPQSMVLKKRSMLIFIFSDKTIPTEAWGQYIASLE